MNKDWIDLETQTPASDQKCWCVDDKNDVYLCRFTKFAGLFKQRWGFANLLGKQWEVPNIKRWQPLIIPTP